LKAEAEGEKRTHDKVTSKHESEKLLKLKFLKGHPGTKHQGPKNEFPIYVNE
jgi:hypothetical protein